MYTPQQRLEHKLHSKLKEAMNQWFLIEDDDKILIGLSGGKDSLALVELLGKRQQVFSPQFKVYAVHIVMKNIPYRVDMEFLQNHCQSHGVEFLVRQTEFDPTVDAKKSPCFLCSWYRRKALFETAEELGCKKIALGHHQDDILITLLMNMTYQGSFATMPVKLKMDKFDQTIIRPMALIKEEELIRFAQMREWPQQKKNCPYEKETHRTTVKRWFLQMEQENPQARFHLWNSMRNVREGYLL